MSREDQAAGKECAQAQDPSQAASEQDPSQAADEGRMSFRVVLASASPRRAELLEDAGVRFEVHASQVDETLEPDLLANPEEACKKLAERKAGAVVQEILADPAFEGLLAVIGSDTMVVKDGRIFGKPADEDDACRMLRCLSGTTHQVMTSVSLWLVKADPVDAAADAGAGSAAAGAESGPDAPGDPDAGNISLGYRTFCDSSLVTFRELSDKDIKDYVACGESLDKAGAYAVQGEGARLVTRIDGYKSTVIGLPVERLVHDFPDLVSQA